MEKNLIDKTKQVFLLVLTRVVDWNLFPLVLAGFPWIILFSPMASVTTHMLIIPNTYLYHWSSPKASDFCIKNKSTHIFHDSAWVSQSSLNMSSVTISMTYHCTLSSIVYQSKGSCFIAGSLLQNQNIWWILFYSFLSFFLLLMSSLPSAGLLHQPQVSPQHNVINFKIYPRQ